jgi:hypothetical protein
LIEGTGLDTAPQLDRLGNRTIGASLGSRHRRRDAEHLPLLDGRRVGNVVPARHIAMILTVLQRNPVQGVTPLDGVIARTDRLVDASSRGTRTIYGRRRELGHAAGQE